jgi:hypothetical protein
MNLIAADTRLEVEIRDVHFFKTQRAFGVLLRNTSVKFVPREGM